ncbi:MAG: hypothetical protein ABWX92_07580 [Mycetocola sp.]
MKVLLTLLVTGVLAFAPVAAEAKARPTSCSGSKTVEYQHGKKIARSYLACPQKVRTPALVSFGDRDF